MALQKASLDCWVQVCYTGDNKGVLCQLGSLRSSSAAQNSIARELALDLCRANYKPIESQFIKEVDNVVADALSRRFAPGHRFSVPECLAQASEISLPIRDRSYYQFHFAG